jgi:hypothetical protein
MCVKTQIWIAAAIYVLVTIVNKRMQISQNLTGFKFDSF